MANNLVLGLVIGASLKGSFSAAFGKANKTIENLSNNLGKATQQNEKLGAKMAKWQERQAALHQKMQLAYLSGDQNIGKLTRRYERMQAVIARTAEKQQHFTRAIQSSEKAQRSLSSTLEKQQTRKQNRDELKGKLAKSTAITASVVLPTWNAVKTYMQQEEAANNLKISMMKADGTFGKFKEIGKIADQLGTDLPGTREDFYKLAKAMKMQGVSDDTLINGGLKTSAKLNVLLEMDQEQGGEFFAKMMESHGLSEAELGASADDLQRAMFAAGMKKDDMYGAMTYYASNVRSMKLTGRENSQKIFAIEGLAAQQGLEGTSFGTNFSTMLDRMSKGPQMIAEAKKGMKAEARDILEKSGVKFNFWDKKGNFKGIDGMVKELEKLQKIRAKFGDQAAQDVADAMFGTEGKRVALLLGEKGTTGLQDFLQKMKDQASIEERVAQKTKTLGSALESLGGAWESAVGNIGSVFADDIKSGAKALQGFVEDTLTPFVSEHKTAIKWIAATVGGFSLLSTGVLATKFAFSGIASIFSAAFMPFKVFKAIKAAKELETLTDTVTKTGRVMKWLGSAFGVVKKAFIGLGKASLTNPIGLTITAIAVAAYLIYDNWEPISAWFANLWTNVTAYFQSFCTWVQGIWNGATEWVSSAWSGVSDYFGQLWNNITTFFNSGIGNITATILNWSPLGLFQQVFSTVLSWFGIDVPSKFTDFGKNMIDGLVNGIRNAWEGAKQIVSDLGDGIKGWFAEKLGIHSPSRVFKGYGVNVVEGLAIGMDNAQPLARDASKNLSNAVKFEPALNGIETAFKPILNEKKGFFGSLWDDIKFGANFVGNLLGINQPADYRTPDFNPNSSGQNSSIFHDYQPLNRNAVTNNETNQNNGIVVNFNPTINVNGSQNQGVMEQVQQGLNMSLVEFERLLNRVLDQRQRRTY
ncbi:phage tail tape measure protein [Haemophilus parainfluenzae]|uniref:phage tail tape measure protein n=1 Tax=Haemophilus parainfluenzae TaxID=729 RepID=UPI0019584F7A|nr:phage tail tape measure protein [Haemophilus parainfluenzae]VTX82041.1 Phage-related minor tail protein [Haemophilus parainfluenzae]